MVPNKEASGPLMCGTWGDVPDLSQRQLRVGAQQASGGGGNPAVAPADPRRGSAGLEPNGAQPSPQRSHRGTRGCGRMPAPSEAAPPTASAYPFQTRSLNGGGATCPSHLIQVRRPAHAPLSPGESCRPPAVRERSARHASPCCAALFEGSGRADAAARSELAALRRHPGLVRPRYTRSPTCG